MFHVKHNYEQFTLLHNDSIMISFDFFCDCVQRGLFVYTIQSDNTLLDRLYRFYTLVYEGNQRMNLVSYRDMERFIEYHILDSLKLASVIDFTNASVLDFGSGAGLPGIPLACVFDGPFTLVDSRLKQTGFLSNAVRDIPLHNTTVIRSRIEDLPLSYNHSFDRIVTRATVSLVDYFLLTRRFLKKGGILAAIKGEAIDDEYTHLVSKVDSKVFNISLTHPLSCDGVRNGSIVIIEKK